jgi:hypothetical protein
MRCRWSRARFVDNSHDGLGRNRKRKPRDWRDPVRKRTLQRRVSAGFMS